MSKVDKTYVFETVLVSGITSGTTTDDFTISATLSGDTLEFSRISGGTYSVVLSGLTGGTTAGPIIFSAETTGTTVIGLTTYTGYGEENACKIRKVDTITGSTYTAFWSNGEETLDKIWVNRYTYSYF